MRLVCFRPDVPQRNVVAVIRNGRLEEHICERCLPYHNYLLAISIMVSSLSLYVASRREYVLFRVQRYDSMDCRFDDLHRLLLFSVIMVLSQLSDQSDRPDKSDGSDEPDRSDQSDNISLFLFLPNRMQRYNTQQRCCGSWLYFDGLAEILHEIHRYT